MSKWIDLNADLGEGCGDDAGILQIVTSCNIACGGHAGDTASMREALGLAKQNGVNAGAHPSYPDRANFGRKEMAIEREALRATLKEQTGALKEIASELGIVLAHVKPHGALYNYAAKNIDAARLIAEIAASMLAQAALIGPPKSCLEVAADEIGLRFIGEGFADRAYEPDGSLRSRALDGAVIQEAEKCATQAIEIARDGMVQTYEGVRISLPAQTICLHGDTPGALASAISIHRLLEEEGIDVRAPSD